MQKMKVREKDKEKATKIIRNFNNKINRVTKKLYNQGEDFSYLPEKIDMREFKKNMTEMTREQFNTSMELLKKFSVRGSENKTNFGRFDRVTTTRWEYKVMPEVAKMETKRRREIVKRQKLDTKELTEQNKHDAQYLGVKVFNPTSFRTQKEYDMYKNNLKKTTSPTYTRDREQQYKNAYLKAIKNNLGTDGNILYNLIKSLDVKTVNDGYWSNDPLLNINYTSDPLSSRVIAYSALCHWIDFLDQNNIKYDKKILGEFDPFDIPDELENEDIFVYDEDGYFN